MINNQKNVSSDGDIKKWIKAWDKVLSEETKERTCTPISEYFDRGTSGNVDGKYWDNVHKINNDIYQRDRNIVSDSISQKELDDLLDESEVTQADLKNNANSIARSPNPVSKNTVGQDQDSSTSLDSTYTDEDLEKLGELKKKLHDLTSDLAAVVDDPSKIKKVQSKIDTLTKEIDDISTSLGQSI